MMLTDALALSIIPRWTIVDTSRPQTVSDHVYRVTVIAIHLSRELDIKVLAGDWIKILFHDADECKTGDIPKPAKRGLIFDDDLKCGWAKKIDPPNGEVTTLLEIADMIEAYTHLAKYGVGQHATCVEKKIFNTLFNTCPTEWRNDVEFTCQAIIRDQGRWYG
jgi:hypothetical protein